MKKNKALEIYKITNRENGKLYIGITTCGYKARWYKHCSDAYRGSQYPLHLAINKYNPEGFNVEVIETCNSIEQLKEREIYWISELKTLSSQNGYNVSLGGESSYGVKRSVETRLKISNSKKGKRLSDTTKYNMRINRKDTKQVSMFDKQNNFIKSFYSTHEAASFVKGNASPIASCARGEYKTMYGYKWSYTDFPLELKEKILPEKKNVIVEKRVVSEDVKKRISETNKKRWVEHPEMHVRASVNNPKSRPILQYSLEGKFIKEYYNVSEAVKAVGASTHTNIAKCARGIRNKSCGYIWKYKN